MEVTKCLKPSDNGHDLVTARETPRGGCRVAGSVLDLLPDPLRAGRKLVHMLQEECQCPDLFIGEEPFHEGMSVQRIPCLITQKE